MDDLDEKSARIARHRAPLRLQIAEARERSAGTCICGDKLIGYIGLLCSGGHDLSNPLLIFRHICQGCVEGGRDEFAKLLEQFESAWQEAHEQTSLLIKSVKGMPAEDWAEIESNENEKELRE